MASDEAKRLEKNLLGHMGRCIADHALIEDGDRILVGVSGGKDSHTMLHLLRVMQQRAPIRFSLLAVNLDQGHPGFPADQLEGYFKAEGYDYRMLKEDTYSIVLEKTAPGKTTCTVCSRLRRGILYNAAVELGCNKIALGHHRDDLISTLLLNMFFAGSIKSMPPRLTSDDGRNVVIRPLAYAPERDIAKYAALKAFPIIPCDLCGTQEDLQRKRMEKLVEDLGKEIPMVRQSLLAAMQNVRPSHLLDPAVSRSDERAVPTSEAPESTPLAAAAATSHPLRS
jgi:tRNA 2-thiocytidine biosynthesis protein TtcA